MTARKMGPIERELRKRRSVAPIRISEAAVQFVVEVAQQHGMLDAWRMIDADPDIASYAIEAAEALSL